MSSLLEKSQPLAAAAATSTSYIAPKAKTTTFFFRSDSIQKIKCTAVYPFRVAGIKLSKNVIIELLETNIKKARVYIQKPMLNFYCAILKLLSTLFTLWDKVPAKASVQPISVDNESSSANKTNGPDKFTTDDPAFESYQTRLDKKRILIQKHKSRLNGDKLFPSTSSPPTANDVIPTATSTHELTCLSAGTQATNSSADNLRLFNLRSTSLLLTKSKYKEYCLFLCVHAGLVVMYLQVVILGIALNTTTVPLGLLFMLAVIAIIGYIFAKVALMHKHPAATKSSPLPKVKNSRHSKDPIKDDFSPERQSRSKTKKLPLSAIELQYKTLSKIKLL